jgi:rRNA-processing protein FCF1
LWLSILFQGGKLNIVIDTNILFNNWLLDGTDLATIFELQNDAELDVHIPEICVLELKNLFRRELGKVIKTLKGISSTSISKQIGLEIPSVDIEKIIKNYEINLDDRIENNLINIPSYTKIPHDSIVKKAIERKKPFRDKDRGYRDALIWEILKSEIIPHDSITYLITNNLQDFCQNKNSTELHGDLLDDLKESGLAENNVVVYKDIRSFVDKVIKPNLEILKEIQNGQYKSFNFIDWFKDNRESLFVTNSDFLHSLFEKYSELVDPTISWIEDPKEPIKYDNAYIINEENISLDVQIVSDVVIDVFIHKSDWSISEILPIDIMDSDWNKSYIWGQLTLELPITISLIINLINEKVEYSSASIQDEIDYL